MDGAELNGKRIKIIDVSSKNKSFFLSNYCYTVKN